MILQALTQYYDALNARGEIDAPGWGRPKISYALQLRENGELAQVIPLLHEVEAGKKKVLRPREDIHLPAAVKRSSGVTSNFMWDNSAYLLGIDAKGKPERSLHCFHAAAELHHKLLGTVDSPFAHAILSFFDTWQPAEAAQHPALVNDYDKIISGANLVFYVNGQYPADDPAICAAWQAHYDGDSDAPKQQCLVTGELDEIAAVHPAIKGVRSVPTVTSRTTTHLLVSTLHSLIRRRSITCWLTASIRSTSATPLSFAGRRLRNRSILIFSAALWAITRKAGRIMTYPLRSNTLQTANRVRN